MQQRSVRCQSTKHDVRMPTRERRDFSRRLDNGIVSVRVRRSRQASIIRSGTSWRNKRTCIAYEATRVWPLQAKIA
jgi:hypothetical protein